MFTPGLRACGYKTASGRREWPNRDPIGRLGIFDKPGRKFVGNEQLRKRSLLPMYGFVRNNPVSLFDLLGLSDNCCCDSATINNNKQQLNDRYNQAAGYLNGSRPWPMPEEGDWSCLNVARNVGHFMAPTPPCWTCYVENRRSQNIWYPFGGYQSHDLNAVVCVSHPKSGNPQKIVFDYWHNAPAGEDYGVFANNYPYSGGIDMNFPGGDCFAIWQCLVTR